MDIKTLEYMKDRVEKAEKIIKRIEHLTQAAESILAKPQNTEIGISTRNTVVRTSPTGSYMRLHTSIITSVHQLIADEIALLEQELAEL